MNGSSAALCRSSIIRTANKEGHDHSNDKKTIRKNKKTANKLQKRAHAKDGQSDQKKQNNH